VQLDDDVVAAPQVEGAGNHVLALAGRREKTLLVFRRDA
jgi:hypothetical protein